jgi:hypothetical protein
MRSKNGKKRILLLSSLKFEKIGKNGEFFGIFNFCSGSFFNDCYKITIRVLAERVKNKRAHKS